MHPQKDHRWWSKDDISDVLRASRLQQAVSIIKDTDLPRMNLANKNARLYGENTIFGYGSAAAVTEKPKLTMNLIKSVVDSVVARITKNRPRPQYITSGGNRSLRRKAKNLTAFTDYAMEEGNASDAYRDAFLDAAVLGTGFVYHYREDTEIRHERILPSEVLVDPQEGIYRTPQTMYRRKWVPREVLASHYPEQAGLILMESPASSLSPDEYLPSRKEDLVEVFEGWRLPTKKGKNDGFYIRVAGKALLEFDPWTYDCFPITPIRYNNLLYGFWGRGIAENLTGLQLELNKNLIKRQKILDLLAVPRVYTKNRKSKATVTNKVGGVYHGDAPVIYAPRTVPPEIDGYIESLWQRGHLLEGISPSEAMGTVPSGLTSGVGIREYDAVVDGKFALIHQAYQSAWMEGAKWVRLLGEEIHSEFPRWKPTGSYDQYSIETVDWESLTEKDDYVLRCMPASSLPTHPGARQQKVIDLAQSGLITDPSTALRLLDFPDLQEHMALDRAQSDYLDWVVEQMLDEGLMQVPEPFHDHQLAMKRVQAAYNRAVTNEDVPEERLALLRDYLSGLMDAVKAQQAEQAQMLAPRAVGGGPATGFDGAPPTALSPEDSPI